MWCVFLSFLIIRCLRLERPIWLEQCISCLKPIIWAFSSLENQTDTIMFILFFKEDFVNVNSGFLCFFWILKKPRLQHHLPCAFSSDAGWQCSGEERQSCRGGWGRFAPSVLMSGKICSVTDNSFNYWWFGNFIIQNPSFATLSLRWLRLDVKIAT